MVKKTSECMRPNSITVKTYEVFKKKIDRAVSLFIYTTFTPVWTLTAEISSCHREFLFEEGVPAKPSWFSIDLISVVLKLPGFFDVTVLPTGLLFLFMTILWRM